jgi:hypothetical protein
MNRFWTRFIGPIIEVVAPRQLMEIGADSGWNTRNILDYCRQTGARADIIDPAPRPELKDVLAAFPDTHVYHPLKSLDAIPLITPPDIALIDGDHNWRTVFQELTAVFARANEMGAPPPIVISHDCGWPYARRDMYYNPSDFSERERHPFAYRGVAPGKAELVDFGMNAMLANALHEGGPQNGVLTGIEDFIASSGVPITFRQLPFFNGLGILIPEARMTPALKALVDSFFAAESLLETCIALERDGMTVRVEVAHLNDRLAQRTEALQRARRLLIEREARINQLEAELTAVKVSAPA